ncbi:MAG: flagellar hook-associated protein FlgK [Pseudomonadota bacterium]
MSISSGLSNAVSGLTAASRTAELVSSNVANATTEGYGKREIRLGTVSNGNSGAGVKVVGIERVTNQAILNDRRGADATLGAFSTTAFYFDGIEQAYGTPDDPASLSAQFARLESALVEAAGTPQSTERMQALLDASKSVVSRINSVADTIQNARQSADQQIAIQVDAVNLGLQKIKELNDEIQQRSYDGGDVNTLMDQRQVQIDQISSIIPLREIPRDDGRIALVSSNGSILLDSDAAVLEFSPTLVITPDMNIGAGSLSGLTISGAAASFGTGLEMVSGGSLSALFDVRDTLASETQSQLDAFSRNLVERFADPALDTTLLPGDAGLFTDGGAAFDPLNEEGLSNRLSLNALVDPAQGGEIWRFRDGLGAVTQGPSGQNALLLGLSDRLNEAQTPASGNFLRAGSSASLVSELLSEIGQSKNAAETEQSYAAAQVSEFKEAELSNGVNTDEELQKLILIEKAYAANAKVISTIDEMLDAILRI